MRQLPWNPPKGGGSGYSDAKLLVEGFFQTKMFGELDQNLDMSSLF